MNNKKQLHKWINVLYSGEYKQGTFVLQSEHGYCCLGVACKVLIPKTKLKIDMSLEGVMDGYMPNEQPNAPKWLKQINGHFRKKLGIDLTSLNDEKRFSFEEIGMILDLIYINKAL